jgi:hypothetical protein
MRICKQTLQARVLAFKRLEFAGVRHTHPAELRFPRVERCCADAVLATEVRCAKPALMLRQNRDDLLFRKL